MELLNKIKHYHGQQKYRKIFDRFKEFTMIPKDIFIANLQIVDLYSSTSGAIVECGTWKGGMIAGIASLLGNNRDYYLFDSFQGLPPAQKIDGKAALHWQANKESPNYFDNCTASIQTAQTAMKLAGISQPIIEKGWFKDTLPKAKFPNGIAVLRMDADWYQSTMQILHCLFKFVNQNGVIIIDDYYTWDGCSRAVHDFLSQQKIPERITSHQGICLIKKT